MKLPIAAVLAIALTSVLSFVTGCAEEDAEGREFAYPVGATVPPSAPPPLRSQSENAGPSVEAEQDSEEVEVGADSDAPQDNQPVDASPSALTDFRGALNPYGSWVEDSTYGTVWVPSPDVVGDDFEPYSTAGHWAYDDEYVWVSDYDWGWAPFHYGRWAYGGGVGWEWIPGRRYAGAWVSWRSGSGYVGWAPMPPAWGWHGGVAMGLQSVPVARYGFVATADLFHPSVASRMVSGDRVGALTAQTRAWEPAATGPLAGRAVAHPAVSGPSPASLNIPQSAVVHASTNPGVARARAFARLNTTAEAARASAGMSRTLTGRVGPAGGTRQPEPSHFGGRMGAGFRGSAAAQAPSRQLTSGGARPYYGTPSSAGAPGVRAAGPSVYRGVPAYHGGAPAGGSHGGGGYSGGSHGGGGGSHGGGGGSHGGGHGGGHR